MKKLRFVLLSALLALSVQTLSAQSVIGTWKAETVNTDDGTFAMLMTFSEDGTFTREYYSEASVSADKTVSADYREGGKWKLAGNGKRLFMKVRPSTISASSDNEVVEKVGKVVSFFQKISAFSTLYFPKVMSLTDDELVLLESFDDDDDRSYTEKVRYVRVK